MKKFIFFLILILAFSFSHFAFSAQASQNYSGGGTCAVYFTGVGCPHCAKTDPVVLGDLLREYPNFTVIEYEVYQEKENSSLAVEYNDVYHSGFGIPLIIFNKDKYLAGDKPILENIRKEINKTENNPCPLVDGSSKSFRELDLASLAGQPRIWRDNRILIKTDKKNEWIFAWHGESVAKKNSLRANPKDILSKFFKEDDIQSFLKEIDYKSLGSISVPLSGRNVNFENAVGVRIGTKRAVPITEVEFTLPKILLLASTDSVNPCALAVLLLILITILNYNPGKKKNVLLAGLSFVFSVFVMYFVYGLIIIKFFQFVQSLTLFRLWLYKILGIIAIILGALNLKDFVRYKPGGLMTEMPLSWRPKAQKIISEVTSPKGAFVIGIFVTLFLLPCTMGPYFIAGGILSTAFVEILKVFPWLLFYNLIFVLPMIAIVAIVYSGFRKVKDIHSWKNKNIKYLHLTAGVIMLVLGVIILMGIF